MENQFVSAIRKPMSRFQWSLGLFALGACLMGASPVAFGQTDPNSPTTQWVPILYGNNNYPDPSADQQTGTAESDIVGT